MTWTQKNISFLVLSILFSCGKESNCIKSIGENITETRAISKNITTVTLEDNVNLILTEAPDPSLKIEGGENLLPYIITNMGGNTLEITNDNRCNFLRSYAKEIIVHLSLPNISRINHYGFGDITSTNTLSSPDFTVELRKAMGNVELKFNTKSLTVPQHNGSASVTLTGSTKDLYLYTAGKGWYHTKGLVAKNTHINHSGTGDMIINVTNNLNIDLYSTGNIDYYGNPTTLNVWSHSGSGVIRKK